MTVYVDDMFAPYRRMLMCHMIADPEDELHVMADKIGIQRKWYQNKVPGGEHYDICKEKRALAIEYGAVAITMRELGRMTFTRKALLRITVENGGLR